MTALTIGDETFEVEVTGDPTHPAIVLSHALGADLTMWDAQVPTLSKQFRVVRYDTRGHGGSTLGAAPVSMARLGADVLAILDALEIETAHFIGLSMGGAVGLWLLANAPDRIGRAVLANTGPRLGSPEVWNERITAALSTGMEALATTTIERWFSASFAAREPQKVERVYAGLRCVSPEAYAACCAALRDADLREALRGIRHDVLVVNGQDDPAVPAADAAAFIAGLDGARHVTLESRHISNIEAEAAFTAAILAFLAAKTVTRPRPKRVTKAKPVAAAAPARAKRSGAARRLNAARSPLKKPAAKRTTAQKASTKKAAETRRRPTSKVTAARRTSTTKRSPAKKAARIPVVPKTSAGKTPAGKTPPDKTPASKGAVREVATARRPTPAAAARGAVKKAKPRKAAPKKPTKAAGKGVTRKMPVARRKPTTKPRRPTGRRKP